MRVLYLATLEARALAWDARDASLTADEVKRLEELMDAVHNLPLLVTRWESCDEELLRHKLASYDAKWGTVSRARLANAYQTVVGGTH